MNRAHTDHTECCKVGRLTREYGLEGFDRELAERWKGERGERESVRTLSEAFNIELLRSVIVDHGGDPIAGEVSNFYRVLTEESVSEGDRTGARRQLEKLGVKVNDLHGEFISHQSLYNHLSGCLDTSLNQDTTDPVENAAETVFSLRNRTRAVTESRLKSLAEGNEIALAEFETFVDVTVTCKDCERTTGIDKLLRSGGCECRL